MQSSFDMARKSYSSAVGRCLPSENGHSRGPGSSLSYCSSSSTSSSSSVSIINHNNHNSSSINSSSNMIKDGAHSMRIRYVRSLGAADGSAIPHCRISRTNTEHISDNIGSSVETGDRPIFVHHSRSESEGSDVIMDSSSVVVPAGSEPALCRGTSAGSSRISTRNDHHHHGSSHCSLDTDTTTTTTTRFGCSQTKTKMKKSRCHSSSSSTLSSSSEDRTPPNAASVVIMDTSSTPNHAFSAALHPQKSQDWSDTAIRDLCGDSTVNDDYARQLLAEEVTNGPSEWYNDMATHLVNRVPMVDWICVTGIDLQLQRETIYRAIRHFDKLCSEKEISTSHLQVIAAACLLIATKWNEKEDKVPMLRELITYCNGSSTGMRWTQAHLKVIECKVLSLLDFSLKTILPIDFVQYHLHCGAVFSDDMLDGHCNIDEHPNATTYVRKFAIFFLDIIAQEYTFWKFRASITAAAVLVASRRALRIVPYWNNRLIDLTGYDWDTIEHCFNLLWNLYRTKFPDDAIRAENTKDYGRKSIDSSSKSSSNSSNSHHHSSRYQVSSSVSMKSHYHHHQQQQRMNDRILVDSTLHHSHNENSHNNNNVSFMDDDEKETSFIH